MTVPANNWDMVPVGEISHKIDNGYKIHSEDDCIGTLLRSCPRLTYAVCWLSMEMISI